MTPRLLSNQRSPCKEYAPHAAYKLLEQWTREGMRGMWAGALWKLRMLTDKCYPADVRAAATAAIVMIKLERNEEQNWRRMKRLRTPDVIYLPGRMSEGLPATASFRAL